MRRCCAAGPVYYVATMALTIVAFAGGWVALFAVGDSWACLGIAALLAFLSTQVAFFGHDAGHQQIFASRTGQPYGRVRSCERADGTELWMVGPQAQRPSRPPQRDRPGP